MTKHYLNKVWQSKSVKFIQQDTQNKNNPRRKLHASCKCIKFVCNLCWWKVRKVKSNKHHQLLVPEMHLLLKEHCQHYLLRSSNPPAFEDSQPIMRKPKESKMNPCCSLKHKKNKNQENLNNIYQMKSIEWYLLISNIMKWENTINYDRWH